MNELKFFRWLPMIFILILISCNKDDDMNIEDDINTETEFFNDGNHVFSYKCQDDNIEFFLDAVSDKSNAVLGSWPDKDIYRIYVDFNSNEEVDSGIDLMFSPKEDNSICIVSLIDQTSASGCSFNDAVFGENLFTSTSNSEELHVNYKVTIPKEVLSNSSSANIVIQLYDSETGWQYFPSSNTFFISHYKISW